MSFPPLIGHSNVKTHCRGPGPHALLKIIGLSNSSYSVRKTPLAFSPPPLSLLSSNRVAVFQVPFRAHDGPSLTGTRVISARLLQLYLLRSCARSFFRFPLLRCPPYLIYQVCGFYVVLERRPSFVSSQTHLLTSESIPAAACLPSRSFRCRLGQDSVSDPPFLASRSSSGSYSFYACRQYPWGISTALSCIDFCQAYVNNFYSDSWPLLRFYTIAFT